MVYDDPLICFLSWFDIAYSLSNGLVWYATIWTIWTYRNDVVFNGKIWDEEQIFELLKIKVTWWMHAKWPNLVVPIIDLA